ncbi:hypothetical protein G9A89_017959 [Geosiphon pyriformis]|nr:hypothetical protein G9A89_017959 [Geosiphon pyriformis]
MEKDSVRMALAVSNKQMWVSKDQHQALLYTLPVGTNAHDLSSLLESYSEKTCFIGHNPNSYVRDRCAVICFGDEASKLAAIGTVPVFKGYSGVCGKRVVSEQDWICLAGIYKKKSAPIARPVSFGSKTWAQVAGGSPSHVISSGLVGAGLYSGLVPSSMMTDSPTVSHLNNQLAILELLTDCVSGILVRLEFIDLVPVAIPSLSLLPAVSETLTSNVNSDIIMNTALVSSGTPLSVVHNVVVKLSSSSSKVLTAKAGGLETKLIALEALRYEQLCEADIICWHKNMNNLVSIVIETKLKGMICLWITDKFDGVRVFTSGLDSGHMGSGVAIIMDSFLAKYVCKISEIPGRLLSLRLLFGNKLSVSILGLYAGASSVVRGDFNEDGSHKSASFKKCFDLGLVNSLVSSPTAKMSTWENFRGVKKTIDYMFVSLNLVNVIANHRILNITVSVSLGLGGLLDMHLNSLCTQVNKDHWKFDIKNANKARWLEFKDASATNAFMFSDAFGVAVRFSNMDAMWDIVHKIMVLSVGGTFKKKWFKGFDDVFTKTSSRFYKLELLVSKLVKTLCLDSSDGFASLLEVWHRLDSPGASVVRSLFFLGSNFELICFALAKARKLYCSSKLLESKCTEESSIKQAIDKRMESFELNKSHTIRSILERLFHKVVLNYLVVEDELVLEPDLVKSKMDKIMEGWTRKHKMISDIFED